MPAFTAVATFIVTSVVGSAAVIGATAFTFLTAVVATGLAVVTSRVLGLGPRGSAGSAAGAAVVDPGVRVQLPPATENRIPIVYGRAYTQGIITDARISNDYKTMTYVLVLSERTQSGTITCGDIYWNDQKLVFKADGFTVEKSILPDTEENLNLDGLVRCWVYAGGTSSAYQIKGPTPAVNAYDTIGTTSNYALSDLVFAVIQIDYNSEKGVTGLPIMTFEILNSLKNPGDVWVDYMTSSRYGAGIISANLDLDTATGSTSTSLKSISNVIPTDQFQSDDTTPSTQPRFEINGVLSANDSVKTNLDKINLASSSWTTFDYKTGLWSVKPNFTASAEQLANAFVFNDDNIIGDISLTSTSLEDLYNSVDVSYFNRGTLDQVDYYKASTDAGELNDLEPPNTLTIQADLINNRIHAGRIGQIEMRQSRVDLIITFVADYTALQIEAGDIIKVTNPIYGFNNKLFRVIKIVETETDNGAIGAEVTALEYSSTVFTDQRQTDAAAKPASDIPSGGTSSGLPPPSAPIVSNVNETANTPNFTIATTISTATTPVNLVEWFYSDSAGGSYAFLDYDRSIATTYNQGQTVNDVITNLVESGTWYFKARTGLNGRFSALSAASDPFIWNPQPAGANQGTINTSTFSSEVFINSVNSGIYNITLTTGTNDYSPLSVDPQISVNVSTNKMYLGNWEVSTVTNAVFVEYASTQSSALVSVTDSQAVYFTEQLTPGGLTNSINTTTLVSPATGTYIVSWVAQFGNAENNVTHRARMWLRENGVDVPRSTKTISIPGAHGGDDGFALLSSMFMFNSNYNDTYELHWSAEDLDVSLESVPASTGTPPYPLSPSVILTAYKLVGAP